MPDTWRPSWPTAILMIVLASWILYRFLAPRRWRDWRTAGLVQAFIIALYAEMYGFPLTLYVLITVLGVDIPYANFSGHLWATLLGLGYVGQLVEMIIGVTVLVVGIGVTIAAWRELYRASAEGRMATSGPYGVVRHPQYTGILLALFGQLIHWPTIPTLVLFPVIAWAYVRLARREERQLLGRFGDAYRAYQQRVPMFLPRWQTWKRLLSPVSGARPTRPQPAP